MLNCHLKLRFVVGFAISTVGMFLFSGSTFAAIDQSLPQAQIDAVKYGINNIQNSISEIDKRVSSIEKQSADNQYREILEKTNQQLSLWWNPYGVMIASLGVLFAVLAGVFAFILWRQSKDYKEENKENFENFLSAQNEKSEAAIKKLDDMLAQKEKEFTSATKEKKAEIQKIIDDLQLRKISIEASTFSASSPVTVKSFDLGEYSMLLGSSFHKCSKCGFGFQVDSAISSISISVSSNKAVACPKCGNVDKIY
ncbi:MAG: hypothetical protein PHO48_05150 [Candidatus Gracilibacteria bacterium]|nr:hypothetical protein [Candidatus Gracilibacteria bacterium]MDD5179553.1 hypothetical protein [Candidatus Gracilibacteria bacterium]